VTQSIEENLLLVDVLSVLKLLVVYGYYCSANDVNEVLKPLTILLSGFSDQQGETSPGEPHPPPFTLFS